MTEPQIPPSAPGRVRIRVLGPLTATRGDSAYIGLGPARQRAVLGLLALQPNDLVHRQELSGALWDTDDPRAAAQLVERYVRRLRVALGSAVDRGDGLRLVSVGDCYRLEADENTLDLLAFRRLVSLAARARQIGDLPVACHLCERALSLWRGAPLADVGLLDWRRLLAGLAAERAELVRVFEEDATAIGQRDRVLPYLPQPAPVAPSRSLHPHTSWFTPELREALMDALADAQRAGWHDPRALWPKR